MGNSDVLSQASVQLLAEKLISSHWMCMQSIWIGQKKLIIKPNRNWCETIEVDEWKLYNFCFAFFVCLFRNIWAQTTWCYIQHSSAALNLYGISVAVDNWWWFVTFLPQSSFVLTFAFIFHGLRNGNRTKSKRWKSMFATVRPTKMMPNATYSHSEKLFGSVDAFLEIFSQCSAFGASFVQAVHLQAFSEIHFEFLALAVLTIDHNTEEIGEWRSEERGNGHCAVCGGVRDK